MSPFEYIARLLYGLPTIDSVELIKAKMNASNTNQITLAPEPYESRDLCNVPAEQLSSTLKERVDTICSQHGIKRGEV